MTTTRTAAAAGSGEQVPTLTQVPRIFVSSAGNDSNDGRSWATAKLTLAAAITALTSNYGDIYLGKGIFTISATITLRSGVRIHGLRDISSAAGGTVLSWTGADDGTPWIQTANTSAGDWSQGVIENVSLGAAVAQSGGGYAINLRNAQNQSYLRNIFIGATNGLFAPNGGGVQLTDTISGSDHAYPGYITMERVWVSGGKKLYDMTAGYTTVSMIDCKGDRDSVTTEIINVSPNNNASTANDFILAVTNFTQEGPGGDAIGVHVTTDANVTLINPAFRKGTAGTAPFITYNATPGSVNDVGGIPIVVINAELQGYPTFLSAPVQGVTIPVATVSGGAVARGLSYFGVSKPPGYWHGTHPDLVATRLTAASAAAGTSPLTVVTTPGQTASLLDIQAVTLNDAFTRADSAISLGVATSGQTWSVLSGTFGISSNKGYISGSPGTNRAAVIETNAADGVLQEDITFSSGAARPWLVFRAIDVDNYLYVNLKRSTGSVTIAKNDAGVFTDLASVSQTLTLGATSTWKVVLAGAVITLYRDGTQILTYTLTGGDASKYASPTQHGIGGASSGSGEDGGSRFDNLYWIAGTLHVTPAGLLGVAAADAGTTKTTPSGVDKWLPVDVAGVTYYTPLYASKTA